MGHGGDSPGKYFNSCSKEDVNKGCYGKLNAEQVLERIELHARRKVEGAPTIEQISKHWFDKYQIEISYQSEKQWPLTAKNSMQIDSKVEEMLQSGQLKRVEVSNQTLINSLQIVAKNNADACKALKSSLKNALNGDCEPWKVLKITEKEYFEADGENLQKLERKYKVKMAARKDSLNFAKQYSSLQMDMSKELRASVKQAFSMNTEAGLIDAKAKRKNQRSEEKSAGKKAEGNEKIEGAKFTEVEIEEARKEQGY